MGERREEGGLCNGGREDYVVEGREENRVGGRENRMKTEVWGSSLKALCCTNSTSTGGSPGTQWNNNYIAVKKNCHLKEELLLIALLAPC